MKFFSSNLAVGTKRWTARNGLEIQSFKNRSTLELKKDESEMWFYQNDVCMSVWIELQDRRSERKERKEYKCLFYFEMRIEIA